MLGVNFDSVEKLRRAAQLRREGADFMDYITDRAGAMWARFFFVDYSQSLGRFVLLTRETVTKEQTQGEEFQELARQCRRFGDEFYDKKAEKEEAEERAK